MKAFKVIMCGVLIGVVLLAIFSAPGIISYWKFRKAWDRIDAVVVPRIEEACTAGDYRKALNIYIGMASLGGNTLPCLNTSLHGGGIWDESFPLAPKITGIKDSACAYIVVPEKDYYNLSGMYFGMFAPNGLEDWYLEVITPSSESKKIAADDYRGTSSDSYLSKQKSDGFSAYGGFYGCYHRNLRPDGSVFERKYSERSRKYVSRTGLDIFHSFAGAHLTTPGKYKLILHVLEYEGEEITAEAEMVVVEKPEAQDE